MLETDDMSAAFVREGENQNLNEVGPTITALEFHLRRENGGHPVKQVRERFDEKLQKAVFEMSDGLEYAINDEGRWVVVLG